MLTPCRVTHAVLADGAGKELPALMDTETGTIYFSGKTMGRIISRYSRANTQETVMTSDMHWQSNIALFWGDDEPEAIVPHNQLVEGLPCALYHFPDEWGWAIKEEDHTNG